MKHCTNCNETKALDDFCKNKAKSDGLSSYCRPCMQAIKRRHYQNNKANVVQKAVDRRNSIKEWFNNYKSTIVCVECGFNHPAAIDFHHIDATTKTASVAMMMRDGLGIDTVKKEIEKCVPLCANCHRIHHWEEYKNGAGEGY